MDSTHAVVDKAYAYATRAGAGTSELELLVFEQSGPDTGVQVPKGTVDEGEEPADAVVRELAEESGVTDPLEVIPLGADRWVHERRAQVYQRHFFHVLVDEPRDEWDHAVTGDGVDEGLTFSCYWACPRSVSLSRDMGRYLHRLID